MRKYIILVSFLLFTNILIAQNTPHPQGSVNNHPELNKFVGTWKWALGNDSLIVNLCKQSILFPAPLNYYEEVLVGWHKYVKNGILIESLLQYSGLPYRGGNSTIFAGKRTDFKTFGSFKDLNMNKQCDLYLTILDITNTQLNWRLRESRGLKPNNFQVGFTLPENIILIKQ